MAPEENPVEETPEVPVIVGDVDTAPDEVVNEGDVTVIVDTPADETVGGDAVEAVVIDNAIDTAERLARMEARLDAVEVRASSAEITADIALDAAEELAEADEEIVEAADAAIVETIENAEVEDGGLGEPDEITTDEIAPVSSRVHWMFRSWSEWRNR